MSRADPARYFIEVRASKINGVFWVNGKRRFRVLCTFADAHLDAQGEPLPDWTDAERDAYLTPLWLSADAELQQRWQQSSARAEAIGLAGALWSAFISAARANRAEGTVDLYETARGDYLAANGDHPLSDFSLHHVDRFLTRCRARKLAPHTVNQRLNALRAFLRWAHDRNELARLPRFPNVPAPRKRPTVLPPEELQALIARVTRLSRTGHPAQRADYRRHLRFLMVGLGCGLRRGEILNLRWEHVDLAAGVITVRITRRFRTKENREKTVPMPGFLQRFLEIEKRAATKREVWLLDNGRGFPAYPGKHGGHSLTNAFRRHLAAIGAVRGVKPTHGQRALFATELHRRGADAYTIQQLMGHSTIAVTEHYLADPDTAKRRAISTLALPRQARRSVGNADGKCHK